jgi:hypothetical protein
MGGIIMDWFKHDSNANLDDKLQEVLLDYGLEGYGLYWYCLELIVGKISSDNITFELKHDARIIARNTGSTTQKVEEMMKRFVELGLFENFDGSITCLKVAKRLMTSSTSNPQMRVMIQKMKENHGVTEPSQHRHDDIMPDKIRLDKIRKDNKTLSRKNALNYEHEFAQFWLCYPKKVGKDKALESWKKKSPRLDDVMFALSWQKESKDWTKEGGKYIPNPATYLNQGRWKDEQPAIEEPF